MYLSTSESEITEEFLKRGYVIREVADKDALNNLLNAYTEIAKYSLPDISNFKDNQDFLNFIHKFLDRNGINEYRLKVINGVNSNQLIRPLFYRAIRKYLDIIVGNELAMQSRLNLSIQCPGDSTSLLPIHADTWSGDSPFEVVAWMPLVDCYKTKSMYILPPKYLNGSTLFEGVKSSESLYQKIKNQIEWIEIKYGEVLIFNQTLPHGNRVNEENETRWSINCRFKSIYSPYGDKKLGEFFEPITLRAASMIGMEYRLPEVYE